MYIRIERLSRRIANCVAPLLSISAAQGLACDLSDSIGVEHSCGSNMVLEISRSEKAIFTWFVTLRKALDMMGEERDNQGTVFLRCQSSIRMLPTWPGGPQKHTGCIDRRFQGYSPETHRWEPGLKSILGMFSRVSLGVVHEDPDSV
jgi:hypothetical protein